MKHSKGTGTHRGGIMKHSAGIETHNGGFIKAMFALIVEFELFCYS